MRTYQLVDLELVFEEVQDDDGDGRDDRAERVDRVAVHEGEHLRSAREKVREGQREGERGEEREGKRGKGEREARARERKGGFALTSLMMPMASGIRVGGSAGDKVREKAREREGQ